MNDFFTSWEIAWQILDGKINEITLSATGICDASFGQLFQTNAKEMQKNITKEIQSFALYAKERKVGPTGWESQFSAIQKAFKAFSEFCDFKDGFWKTQYENQENNFVQGVQMTETLLNNGFFDDRKKMQEESKTKQASFSLTYAKYKNLQEEIERLVKKDFERFSEDDFKSKYNMTKKELRIALDGYKKSQTEIEKQWEKYQSPFFVGNLLSQYDTGDAETRTNKIDEYRKFLDFFKMEKPLSEGVNNLRKWIIERDEKINQNKKQNAWTNRFFNQEWVAFSISDVIKVIKISWAEFKKEMESDAKEAQAKLGIVLWGEKNKYGKVFKSQRDSMDTRVADLEKEHEKSDIPKLWDFVKTSSDKDVIRACITNLVKKGAFKYDDTILWSMLNRMQSKEYFIEDDKLKTFLEQREKVKSACKEIWGKDTIFNAWD